MASDVESGLRAIIDLSVKAASMSVETLQAVIADFMVGKTEKRGRMSVRELARKTPGKLENVEITDQNIRDFLRTARKYDVDYALRRDSSTTPPTYHVFFSSPKAENIKNAFREYTERQKSPTAKRGFSRELLHAKAQQKQRTEKEKEHERAHEAQLGR